MGARSSERQRILAVGLFGRPGAAGARVTGGSDVLRDLCVTATGLRRAEDLRCERHFNGDRRWSGEKVGGPRPRKAASMGSNAFDVVIAGVNKAGTTSLFVSLATHPERHTVRGQGDPVLPSRAVRRSGRPGRGLRRATSRADPDPVVRLEATPSYFYGGAAVADVDRRNAPRRARSSWCCASRLPARSRSSSTRRPGSVWRPSCRSRSTSRTRTR